MLCLLDLVFIRPIGSTHSITLSVYKIDIHGRRDKSIYSLQKHTLNTKGTGPILFSLFSHGRRRGLMNLCIHFCPHRAAIQKGILQPCKGGLRVCKGVLDRQALQNRPSVRLANVAMDGAHLYFHRLPLLCHQAIEGFAPGNVLALYHGLDGLFLDCCLQCIAFALSRAQPRNEVVQFGCSFDRRNLPVR